MQTATPSPQDPTFLVQTPDGGIAFSAFRCDHGLVVHAPDGVILGAHGDQLERFASLVADAVDAERERVKEEGPPGAVKAMRQCPSCRGAGKLKSMGAEAQECPVCDGTGKVD